MATKAGIPLSRANCICDLCESLGAKDMVKIFCESKNPPKLATCKNEKYVSVAHQTIINSRVKYVFASIIISNFALGPCIDFSPTPYK